MVFKKFYCVPKDGSKIYLTKKLFMNGKAKPNEGPQWAGGWPSIIGGAQEGTSKQTLNKEAEEETQGQVIIPVDAKLSDSKMYIENGTNKETWYYTCPYTMGAKIDITNKGRSFYETDGNVYKVDLSEINTTDAHSLADSICSKMGINHSSIAISPTKEQFYGENQHKYLTCLFNIVTNSNLQEP